MRLHDIPNARPVGKLNGRKVYEFTVLVRHNDSSLCATVLERVVLVKTHSAAEAANAIRSEVGEIPETEIHTRGPRGGLVERFVGWESAIGNMLFCSRRERGKQLGIGL